MRSSFIVILVSVAAGCVCRGPAIEPDPKRVLAVAPIDAERTLVLVRGARISPAALHGTFPSATLPCSPDQFGYELRAELHAWKSPPVVLAAGVSQLGDDGHYDVLDVLAERDGITIAVIENFTILIWRVGSAEDGMTCLNPLWSASAVLPRRNWTNVSAHLRRDTNDRLTVEIVDLLPDPPDRPHSLYQQVEGAWHFELVEQHTEAGQSATSTSGVEVGQPTSRSEGSLHAGDDEQPMPLAPAPRPPR